MAASLFAPCIGLLTLAAPVLAQVGAPDPSTLIAAAAAAELSTDHALAVAPLTNELRARPGTPTVIAFRVGGTAPFARTARAVSADPAIVRVIDSGHIAPDHTLGFAVVEGVADGSTTVTIAGAPVHLTVARDPLSPDPAGDPTIISPIDGAAAFGTIGVCITWWRPGAPADSLPQLIVGQDTAHPLAPVWTNTPADGPTALATFLLDTDSLSEGPVSLHVVRPGQSAPAHPDATPLSLRIFHPEPDAVLGGECEADYDLPPLPDERKEGPARIIKNAKASGGAYFDNAGSQPHFRFPIEISDDAGPGWYQVILTAGGDAAVSTLPSVGLAIDQSQYPLTRSAIAMPAFHRTPLGVPFRLEPGRRVLRIDFLNDFYVAAAADRNLRLDRIEVLRVADAGRSVETITEASAMMAAPAMAAAAPRLTPDAGESMMNMTGAGGNSAPPESWPVTAASKAARGASPVIAFARPLDGMTICGDLDIRAAAWWPGAGDKGSRSRLIHLYLNGRPFAEQFALAPRFIIPFEAFAPGNNTLSLVLSNPGAAPASAEARISVPKPSPVSEHQVPNPRPPSGGFHRFTVHDPRWSAEAGTTTSTEQSPPEKACFALFSNAELVLNLPNSLEGDYALDIEARGQSFKGPPQLKVSVASDAGEADTVSEIEISNGWDTFPVLAGKSGEKNRAPAIVHLARGRKALHVAFTNDLYEPEKGDRNVFVQAVVLRTPRAPLTNSALGADVLYPANDSSLRAGGADAIIFCPCGPTAPKAAELVVDGVPTGQLIDLAARPGPFLLPVSLRDISPGPHDLAVRLTGPGKVSFTTSGRRVRATNTSDTAPTVYERTIALLDRLAFGPDERELVAALTIGPDAYLDLRLSDDAAGAHPGNASALARARYPGSAGGADVQRRAILEALQSDNPVRSRFTLFAENHFSTWLRKAEPRRKADEHERFVRLGVAPFFDLLLASATGPSMLRYLDQEQSYARRLNENYAREIMELHTLGVRAGYTQDDVTSLARILTGWTTSREAFTSAAGDDEDSGVGPDEFGMREAFRYDPALADSKPQVFLGRTFAASAPAERHQRVLTALGLLAAHPSTARFISTKLAEHSLTSPAPTDLVDRLTSVFERTGGDMRALLLALARDPAFMTEPPGRRLCHPPDFAFRLARAVGSADANAVHDYLNLAGHGLFDRSTPDGYQESDTEEMDSNAMLQRWKLARRLEAPLLDLVPAQRRSGDKPIDPADAQSTIDLVAIRLTGRLLGASSNAATLDLLNKTEGKRDERWRAVVTFIASTPEAQLK